MEYDNDRIIRGNYKSEPYRWLLFVSIQPVVNGLAVFPHQPPAWIILLINSLLVLPLYLLYGGIVIRKFLFTRRWLIFLLITVCLFPVLLMLIFSFYAWMGSLVPAARQEYFSYSTASLLRESVWIGVNGFFVFILAWFRRYQDEEETRHTLRNENMYYKLRYFRTQLNPHFLFNTLNSIYSLCLTKDDKAPDVVIRLAEIMRFLIYECNEDKIPLEKEIEFIRNYIEIEKMRYDADIRFTVEGDTEGVMIEPFLFISFIENGFKHAIDNSFAKPFIYITLKADPQRIALNVINNTSHELETQAKKVQGKGLVNSKNVLELLYPDAYALDIIQTEIKDRKESKSRFKNAQERLQRLYPDTHTLDIILKNNTFTVSLILLTGLLDKMYHHRR